MKANDFCLDPVSFKFRLFSILGRKRRDFTIKQKKIIVSMYRDGHKFKRNVQMIEIFESTV